MGCYYKPWEDTQKFLDLVYEKDSKIVAVLGGHLHFEYDCQLTDSVREHVFDASYKGNIGVITISGTNSDSGK